MKFNNIYLANFVITIASLLLFLPLIQSFFFPIELEVRESTLWLHILTIKEGINIYKGELVAYANQAHGPIDPIFKYIIHFFFNFLEPWQVSRLNNILLFFIIFLINIISIKKKEKILFSLFLSVLIYSLIFLFTKSFQGRADITAMLLISILCFLCSRRNIYEQRLNSLIVPVIFSLTVLTNWRFLPACLLIALYPLFLSKNLSDLFSKDKFFNLSKFLLISFLPFFLILYFLFDLNLNKYSDYFFTFFYFESHFAIDHFFKGLLNLLRVEKVYLLFFLVIIFVLKLINEVKEYQFVNLIKVTSVFLIITTSTVSYLYNFVGGGIYYFTPVIFVFWFLVLDCYRNNNEIDINFNKIFNIILFFISLIIITISLKNSLKASLALNKGLNEAKNLHNFLKNLNENNSKILSESLHFHKLNYGGEKIDIGDLISYRSTQVGGNYEKTYLNHLNDLKNLKYNYIVHNFTGSKLIDELVEKNNYEIIKTFSKNYSNIGEIFILKKVGLEN